MIDKIMFWDRMRAEAHVYDSTKDVVVSITDPNKDLAAITGSKDIHRVQFYDVVESVKIDDNFTMDPMSLDQARALHAKVVEWEESKDHHQVIIHCEAGASRSGAVALYVFMHTMAYFPTIGAALYASSHVLKMMEEVTGLPCLSAIEVAKAEGSLI